MKSKYFLIPIVLALCLCAACESSQEIRRENVATTDLSSVFVDGITTDIPVENVDLTKYTLVANDQTAGEKNTEYFEELVVKTDDDGVITSVKGIYGTGIEVTVNDSRPLTIDDIKVLLGANYNGYWFDREQNIKAYTYYDEAISMYATFAAFDNTLVWVILSN